MAKFSVVLSNFELKDKRNGVDKLLRFTLTWMLELETGTLGASSEGCIAHLGKNNLLEWAYSTSREGGILYHRHVPFKAFYKLVLDELSKRPEIGKLKRRLDDVINFQDDEDIIVKEIEV